jgi:hypothetical protein
MTTQTHNTNCPYVSLSMIVSEVAYQAVIQVSRFLQLGSK